MAIPEVAGGAAVLMDPLGDDAVVDGLERAATDGRLRARLSELGPLRAADLTWHACAAATVSAYEIALGLPSRPLHAVGP